MSTLTKSYDYLIVGSGLFGCIFAYELQKAGLSCLVIDKRNHLGGNIYCTDEDGIHVQQYGAHIFHTNDYRIWSYVTGLVPFNQFVNSPLARYCDRLYNLPFNMNTFYQLWGVITPDDARKKLKEQTADYQIGRPKNLEEQALSLVGRDIYYSLIKGYSEKQWGRSANELPPSLIKRIPLRFTFNNNYFDDRFQGIPIGGYNQITKSLLANIPTETGVDYLLDRQYFDKIARKIVYTGALDAFFDYEMGRLEYRSLAFKHERLENSDFQGNAVINYSDYDVPFTRIIEHKHFEFGKQKHTIITREYPQPHLNETEPYYPINDIRNLLLADSYKALGKKLQHVIFGGRLAEYRYYDMDQVIASALKKVKIEIEKK